MVAHRGVAFADFYCQRALPCGGHMMSASMIV